MVPWPIALLAVFYALIATASAASVWRIISGMSHQALGWPLGWLAASSAAVYGLVLLRSWARRLALIGFIALCVIALAVAGLSVTSGAPVGGLLSTLIAGGYVVAIRYLQRPSTKAYFGSSEFGVRNLE